MRSRLAVYPLLPYLLCLLVWSWCLPARAEYLPTRLFRVDTRDPLANWMFQQGFHVPGSNQDLVAHVTGGSVLDRSSAFISTTDQRSAAERIALARLVNGNPMVWIYEIRASNLFYEVNASLRQAIRLMAQRDGHDSAQMTNLEIVEALYGHQYEWVAREIPSTSIFGARAYHLAQDPSRSDTEPRLVEVAHTNLFNPNYIELPSTGNNQIWPILPPHAEVPRSRMLSLADGLRSIGLSWCAGVSASIGSVRTPRSVNVARNALIREPDCLAPVKPAKPYLAKVWDASLKALVWRPVPWRSVTLMAEGRSLVHPAGCMLELGKRQTDSLVVNCLSNLDYAHFGVQLKASGPVSPWVDTAFKSGYTNENWEKTSSEIPVVNTNWMLSDYHYSMHEVFSPQGGVWTSQITVAPFYPDLTYAGRQKRASRNPLDTTAFIPSTFPSQNSLLQPSNQLPSR